MEVIGVFGWSRRSTLGMAVAVAQQGHGGPRKRVADNGQWTAADNGQHTAADSVQRATANEQS